MQPDRRQSGKLVQLLRILDDVCVALFRSSIILIPLLFTLLAVARLTDLIAARRPKSVPLMKTCYTVALPRPADTPYALAVGDRRPRPAELFPRPERTKRLDVADQELDKMGAGLPSLLSF